MKNSKKSAKNNRQIFAIIVMVIVVAAVIAIIAAVTNRTMISQKSVGIDEEFYLEPGQTVYLRELGDTPLKLESIENGLYIDNDTDPDQIIFSWEGQIYYHFKYDDSEIVVGSVLEADTSRPLTSIYTINYVEGSLEAGTFILRKIAE